MVRDEFLGAAGASGGGGGGPSTFAVFNVGSSGAPSATSLCGLVTWSNTTGFGTGLNSGYYYQYVLSSPSTSLGISVPSTNPSKTAVTFAHPTQPPYIFAYPVSISGFGTKYSDPSVAPSGSLVSTANNGELHISSRFSPSGQAVLFAGGSTDKLIGYRWLPGFGTKFTNPSTLPGGNVSEIAFAPDGTAVFVSSNTSPYIHAYPWNDSTGFGTKYSNPSVLPTETPYSFDIHPDGNAVILNGVNITAYRWSSSGFGTRYTQLATNFANSNGVNSIKFSPTGGAFVAFGVTGVPIGTAVKAYAWNYTSGIGSSYTVPSAILGGAGSLSFSGDGTVVAIPKTSAPKGIMACSWTDAGGFGTAYSNFVYNPADTLFVGDVRGVYFN